MPEDNRKQNPEESCTNKYQKHIAYSYGYNLVCVDDKFSNPFKTYLGKDAVYKFINNMIEESKYCGEAIRNILRKNLWWLKEDNENCINITKCWICDDDYVDNDVKVWDYCHITGKYGGSNILN